MVRTELNNIKDVIDFQVFKYGRGSGMTYKELFQIGYLGYLKALDKMDPARGISLTYAAKYIRQELAIAIKKEQKELTNRGYLATPTWAPESDPLLQVPDKNVKNPTDTDALKKIEALLPRLKRDEAHIIREYYFAEKPKRLRDLAEEMGVKKQRIHEIKEVAIQKLRELCKANKVVWRDL